MNKITKISKLDGFSITNFADGGTKINQSVLFIQFEDNSKTIIDLSSNFNITNKVKNKHLKLNINNDILHKEIVLWRE